MEDLILETIQKYGLIKTGDRIGVGFSGGGDSVALLNVLNNLSKKIGFKLFAVHINHGIRGEEALRDEKFAESFCKKIGVDLITKNVYAVEYSKSNKLTLEEGARILRYQVFDVLIKELKLNKIALAHHKNDQAESILMHIGRGSGLNGLVGMTEFGEKYIRPLLGVSKKQILDYLKQQNLTFVTDSSNNSLEYSRNFMRKKVVESYEKLYPKLTDNLYKLSKKVQEENEFLDSLVKKRWFRKENEQITILDEVASLHPVLKMHSVINAFKLINKSVDIEEKHLRAVVELFSKQVGKRINLPQQLIAVRKYDGVCICLEDNEKKVDFYAEFKLGQTKFNDYIINVERVNVKDIKFGDGLYIDYLKLPKKLMWRTIQEGDVIQKFDGKSRKLKQFLVDKKVDSLTRKTLPILMYGNNCLVVLGVEISKMVAITNARDEVLKISYTKK